MLVDPCVCTSRYLHMLADASGIESNKLRQLHFDLLPKKYYYQDCDRVYSM